MKWEKALPLHGTALKSNRDDGEPIQSVWLGCSSVSVTAATATIALRGLRISPSMPYHRLRISTQPPSRCPLPSASPTSISRHHPRPISAAASVALPLSQSSSALNSVPPSPALPLCATTSFACVLLSTLLLRLLRRPWDIALCVC